MIRRPPRSTRTDTLFPYTTLFRAAVAERVTLLGLRRNSARPWTEFDDAELVRRYGSDPTAAIASHLGRSCAAVYARARAEERRVGEECVSMCRSGWST